MRNSRLTRRDFLKASAVATGAAAFSDSAATVLGQAAPAAAARRVIAPGPFAPTWDSLTKNYRAPEWFRDAKFGIWAHWTAQCVPEQGDWYARRMYLQGDPAYDYHVKTLRPPVEGRLHGDRPPLESRALGTREADGALQTRRREIFLRPGQPPRQLRRVRFHAPCLELGQRTGPKQDIVGTWAKVARAQGLKFGVSNHSAHAWHWFQAAYGYDAEGPLAGVRYDAARLTKADGAGKWWDGLDPQELYTGPNIKIPDGLTSIKAMNEWHEKNDRVWNENPPAMNPAFTEQWFLRCQDLVDKYHPDVLYFDNTELPLGQAGLDIVAHYYNASAARTKGAPDVVVNAKHMTPEHVAGVVEDIERGVATGIRPLPWQTDTCIGSWHYSREIAEQNKYKTVPQVIAMLLDIVSKNGNLMLSIPVRGTARSTITRSRSSKEWRSGWP